MWRPNRSPRCNNRLPPEDSFGKTWKPTGRLANDGPINNWNPRWPLSRSPKKRAPNAASRRDRPRDRHAPRPAMSVAFGPGGAGDPSPAGGLASGGQGPGAEVERGSFRLWGGLGAMCVPTTGTLCRTQGQNVPECPGTAHAGTGLLSLLRLPARFLPPRPELGPGRRFSVAGRRPYGGGRGRDRHL